MKADRQIPLTYGDRTTRVEVREPRGPAIGEGGPRTIIITNGAGAAMHHPFIEFFYTRLAELGLRTVRFNFLYQHAPEAAPKQKRRPPDRAPVLEDLYLRVIDALVALPDVDASGIVGGGKSMGGRIAAQIAKRAGLQRLVFWGYPLHPPGKPERVRDAQLYDLQARMLFLQGTRDPFATPEIRDRVYGRLERTGRAQLILIPEGDHSFHVPKRVGLSDAEVLSKVAEVVARFCA